MAVDGVGLAFEQVARMEMSTVPLLAFSAELLALDASQLDERIQHELSSNPALQVTRRCTICGAWAPAAICRACRRPRPTIAEEAARRSARSELLVEALAVAPRGARRAVEAVVASLDQHGLLTRTSPDEIRVLARCTGPEVEQALRAVRDVGPAGLASFDARGCLLAQIDELTRESCLPPGDWLMARRIVDHHLPALAAGDVEAIAADLPARVAEVQSAATLIRRRLTPYPDIDLTDDQPGPGAPPDMVFRRTSGGLVVEVNDPWRGELTVSAEFDLAATRATDRDVRHFMKQQLQRARLFVAALDRRRATIHRVATAVAAHHHDALVAGSPVYRQLRRRDVAAALDLHESTVSRAVKDRMAELPDGRVVPLATMFGPGQDVRAALARLLATEKKCSDQRLSEMLRAQGIPAARRTVAKYRKQMAGC